MKDNILFASCNTVQLFGLCLSLTDAIMDVKSDLIVNLLETPFHCWREADKHELLNSTNRPQTNYTIESEY